MSDVLLYLVRLADKCDVNLADAVIKKIEKNAAKYPAHLVKGSSAKYHKYSGKAVAPADAHGNYTHGAGHRVSDALDRDKESKHQRMCAGGSVSGPIEARAKRE